MKRKLWILFALAIVLIAMLLLFRQCGIRLSMPKDTDLAFFITEKVTADGLAGFTQRYGMMGGREYYGMGYAPTIDENGQQVDPEQCVIYKVTSYPDYLCNAQHVTGITITDPTVSVYGLTMESAPEHIIERMKAAGYRYRDGEYGLTFTKGNVRICFTKNSITLTAKVSNLMRIQF